VFVGAPSVSLACHTGAEPMSDTAQDRFNETGISLLSLTDNVVPANRFIGLSYRCIFVLYGKKTARPKQEIDK